MDIKIKPIDRNEWKRVLKKKVAYADISERKGVACLMKFEEITSPLIKPCFGRDVTLVDVGYYWLQIGFENENYWLTTMFDREGNFVQYYFDITRNNVIDGEKSWFEDLFLDIIVQEKDEVEVLDADELKLALEENVITNEEFEFVNETAEKIIENVLKNRNEYDTLCFQYFKLLRSKLGE